MDPSKEYGCINTLISKLAAYGFDKMAVSVITDYLTNHLERLKWVIIPDNFIMFLVSFSKAYVMPSYKYWPRIWMFCGKTEQKLC